MRVKLKQETNRYLAYFIDSRRIVGVNETGAKILDWLFNQNKNVGEITALIADDYRISRTQARSDLGEFLSQVRTEIHPSGFNVIEQEQLEVPLGVELEITTGCNLRCRHCFQEHHDGTNMPTDMAIRIINLLADNQVCEISLIGGEPFRHEELMAMLACCQEREMAITLVTNATLINETVVDQLTAVKRLVVLVSLDGPPSIHDYIRGEGVFNRADAALKLFQANGVPVEVICTLNAVNLPVHREVVEYCEGLDIPCNFSLFKPFRAEHGPLILNPESFFETVAGLLALRRNKGYKIGLANAAVVSTLLGLSPRNECRATQSGMVIDITGRMVPCPSLVASGYYQDNELPLFDNDFVATWRNYETFVRFRQNGLRECQARSLIFSGDVRGYDPYGITAFRKYWAARTAANA